MSAMPSTIVRKMIGAITIFTRLMKVSPTGFIAAPRPARRRRAATPSEMATSTRTVRLRLIRWRRDSAMGGSCPCGSCRCGSVMVGATRWVGAASITADGGAGEPAANGTRRADHRQCVGDVVLRRAV